MTVDLIRHKDNEDLSNSGRMILKKTINLWQSTANCTLLMPSLYFRLIWLGMFPSAQAFIRIMEIFLVSFYPIIITWSAMSCRYKITLDSISKVTIRYLVKPFRSPLFGVAPHRGLR